MAAIVCKFDIDIYETATFMSVCNCIVHAYVTSYSNTTNTPY